MPKTDKNEAKVTDHNLLELPEHLLRKIAKFLDEPSKKKLSAVNKKMDPTLKNLKTKLQSEIQSLKDDPYRQHKLNNLLLDYCMKNNMVAINFLLEAGADPTARFFTFGERAPALFNTWLDKTKCTALHIAYLTGNWGLLQTLWSSLEKQNKTPDLNTITDGYNRTLLHYCTYGVAQFPNQGHVRKDFVDFYFNKNGANVADFQNKTFFSLLKEMPKTKTMPPAEAEDLLKQYAKYDPDNNSKKKNTKEKQKKQPSFRTKKKK